MADVIYVVDQGLQIINNRLKGTGTEPVNISWGTGGATVATPTQTALVNATPTSTGARVVGTSSVVTTTTTGDTYQVTGTLTSNIAALPITEIGLFDDITAGTMFLRGTFDVITVNSGDSIAFTILSQIAN